MKTNDIIGFAAILIAGFMAGKDYESSEAVPISNAFIVIALLGIGWYFAVRLS